CLIYVGSSSFRAGRLDLGVLTLGLASFRSPVFNGQSGGQDFHGTFRSHLILSGERVCPPCIEISFRVCAKLLEAPRAAKVICLIAVTMRVAGRGGIHLHSTDRIQSRLPRTLVGLFSCAARALKWILIHVTSRLDGLGPPIQFSPSIRRLDPNVRFITS